MSKSGLVTPNSVSMPQSYSTLETGVPELKPLSSGLKGGSQSPRAVCCAVWMGTIARTGILTLSGSCKNQSEKSTSISPGVWVTLKHDQLCGVSANVEYLRIKQHLICVWIVFPLTEAASMLPK